MNLKDQGFRFYVSEDRKQAKWMHPAEVPAGWIDCTEFDDQQFEALIGSTK